MELGATRLNEWPTGYGVKIHLKLIKEVRIRLLDARSIMNQSRRIANRRQNRRRHSNAVVILGVDIIAIGKDIFHRREAVTFLNTQSLRTRKHRLAAQRKVDDGEGWIIIGALRNINFFRRAIPIRMDNAGNEVLHNTVGLTRFRAESLNLNLAPESIGGKPKCRAAPIAFGLDALRRDILLLARYAKPCRRRKNPHAVLGEHIERHLDIPLRLQGGREADFRIPFQKRQGKEEPCHKLARNIAAQLVEPRL